MAESLVKVQDVLFDENCYQEIKTEDEALSYVRYYSKNVAGFRGQLVARGWDSDDINSLIDTLWKRIIAGCKKFRIPLTKEGEMAAKRLSLQ